MQEIGNDAEGPLLRIEQLKTHYPAAKTGLFSKKSYIKAVDGVSFAINPGESLGLVGESGCGKSTLGRTIVRLERPTEGAIYYRNENIARKDARSMLPIRRELQIIFQDPYGSLNPRKKIGELIAEPMLVHGIATREDVHERVASILDKVGIRKDYYNRYPHQFSGGQRQRIGIARALALNPRLIVCDEPVSALDVSIQVQILNLLKDLQQELRLTYLFIAHGLGSVKYISDRVAVMYLGKIVELGTTKQVFQSPRHPYTKLLLAAYPAPNPRRRAQGREQVAGDVQSAAALTVGCRFQSRCPLATALCRETEPVLRGAEHAVACHYPLV